MSTTLERHKVLVIDDTDSIHADFKKTLDRKSPTQKLAEATSLLFAKAAPKTRSPQTFDVESAYQGEEGLRKVAEAVSAGNPYALAFVDMRMPPGWDGVETIQHLWQADPELQVVICTAHADYSWDEIVDKLGATDRLLILKKPFDPMEVCQLATALSEKWKLKRQATMKLEVLEKMVHERTTELRRLALSDKLTGLPNRAWLSDTLRKLAARAAADPTLQYSVLFLDFDRFKAINDSLGHEAGDELLIQIAERLRRFLKQNAHDETDAGKDVAARLGGDEFVIVRHGQNDCGQSVALAQELLALLNEPYKLTSFEVHITVSIGIATNATLLPSSPDILCNADSAMYRAKSLGKARYAFFSPDMHKDSLRALQMENELRRALKENQLRLYYQPIVSMADAHLVGFEALLRWQHPTQGLLPPDEIIALAEENGLIHPIGQWVITEACRQLSEWRKNLPRAEPLTVSVNCSMKQLVDFTLVQVIADALAQFNLPPAVLHLEITESAVMEQRERACEILQKLTAIGVKIHMDDFGTGYSSLSCLHIFPFSVLKVDRSFIKTISLRRDYAAVIDAVIALAHNLGMQVVAEGVETAEHAAMLCAMECDLAQGYYFAKPLPALDAEIYINKKSLNPQSAAAAPETAIV